MERERERATGGGEPRDASDAGISISVILPVLNGAATLPQCLAALRRSSFQDFEIIAVDDGSIDATAAVLTAAGVDVVLRNDACGGCFAARNRAVLAARGDVLFFTDADVAVAPDTLEKVWRLCAGAEAAIGVYSLVHPHENLASQYKNAWIRWSYLCHGEDVDWFFTAVGAVRRSAWERIGGFDEGFDRRLGGGDVDFGHRLGQAGIRVRLDKSLAVVHHRRFTLASLLGNDFHRARGWTALGLARRGVKDSAARGIANVSGRFVASVALGASSTALCAGALAWPALWPLAGLSLAAYGAAAMPFPWWVAREKSASLALQCAALQLLDHLACGAGVAVALGERLLRRAA